MKSFQRLNNALGWFVFAITSMVYIATSEPTASFWDCGEYIATSYKLMVGHPPGAPFFQLLGRFFSLFAFNDVTLVARMINTMSALMSGFTILFLFWSITLLGRKLVARWGEFTSTSMWAVLGSGLVGALAYTFSDSFWFSAVEGEVYASSSFFTAVTFWAILKWESVADEKHHLRWLVLIAYLIGLSIGVHLLNLLAIPAVVMVYYFKKSEVTLKKTIYVTLFSFVLVFVVLYIIVPYIVIFSGLFERMFVNTFGLPFNVGTIFYFALFIGGIVWGIRYSIRKHKVILNTALLGLIFILIGYSTFFILVIRSNANTPLDENNPEDATSLQAYLAREQYGSTPLFSGPYYNAPVVGYKDGNPVYTKAYQVTQNDRVLASYYNKQIAEKFIADNAKSLGSDLKIKGTYVISDARKNVDAEYDPRFTTFFPRMYSSQEQMHIDGYKDWGHVKGTPISITNARGEQETVYKPTFLENMRYFFFYQLNYMYWRYFMWNFAGKQNDSQGRGDINNGNWISGISFIDEIRLGPQDKPDAMKNAGTNKFYFLPFILGLLGLFYQFKKSGRDSYVVGLLFIMTGFAIVIYLNQYAYQPRERDYAYAASFYAFAIWIGLGVIALVDWLRAKMQGNMALMLSIGLSLILVPGIMAKEGWDDHNRANRYTARDFAINYLESCAPNAILFTNGDNDTFPLWYVQEVEGIRRDVRVVNLSLLNTDWYVDQMKRRAYESAPVEFSLTKEQYIQGVRDFVAFDPSMNPGGQYVNIKEAMDFVKNDNHVRMISNGQSINFFPTNRFSIPVDTTLVLKNGTLSPSLKGKMLKSVDWQIDAMGVQKNSLMILDLLANFDWKRPVYFAITTGNDAYIGLTDYFQLEGLTYRLIPAKIPSSDGQTGFVNTSIMYNNLMNKFKWGNMDKEGVYLDETNLRMIMNLRNNFARLADQLVVEGKKDSALKVLDRCMELMPEKRVPYNIYITPIIESYLKAGALDKGVKIMERMIKITDQNLAYYFMFKGREFKLLDYDVRESLVILQRIAQTAQLYKLTKQEKQATELLNNYYTRYETQSMTMR